MAHLLSTMAFKLLAVGRLARRALVVCASGTLLLCVLLQAQNLWLPPSLQWLGHVAYRVLFVLLLPLTVPLRALDGL